MNKILNIDMNINDFAEFMFKKNVNNAEIYLELGGIEDNKDLFYFCLDLFCKGLIYMFGENGKVNIELITHEQFYQVKQKMLLAGIIVNLTYQDITNNLDQNTVINLDEIEKDENNLNLKDYEFTITTDKLIYKINFDLTHNRH
jgi:hypothetical protein